MRLALSIHFVAFTARVQGEILFMPRFMEDANLGRRISLSLFFLFFLLVSKNSIPGKFTEKWHIGRVGETATKSEKKRSLFN